MRGTQHRIPPFAKTKPRRMGHPASPICLNLRVVSNCTAVGLKFLDNSVGDPGLFNQHSPSAEGAELCSPGRKPWVSEKNDVSPGGAAHSQRITRLAMHRVAKTQSLSVRHANFLLGRNSRSAQCRTLATKHRMQAAIICRHPNRSPQRPLLEAQGSHGQYRDCRETDFEGRWTF